MEAFENCTGYFEGDAGMIALDLGSNTLQSVFYDCEGKIFGGTYEKIVRTAEGLHKSGRISDAALRRIIDAILELKRSGDFSNHTVVAVTTAAMRMAENAAEALLAINTETGVSFRIIDADEEAAFTQRAVSNRLHSLGYGDASYVLIDIGGGSSEVIVVNGTRSMAMSFPVGIVTTAEQCRELSKIEPFLKAQLGCVKLFAEEAYAKLGRPAYLVATAGTPTTMAAYLEGMTYATYDGAKINGFKLELNDCKKVYDALLAMEEDERAVYVGVGREDLIAAGIVIVELFYELLGFEEAIVVNDGVREGVALAYCEEAAL